MSTKFFCHTDPCENDAGFNLSNVPKAEGLIKCCQVDVECDVLDPYCKAIGVSPECNKFFHICACRIWNYEDQLSADNKIVHRKLKT